MSKTASFTTGHHTEWPILVTKNYLKLDEQKIHKKQTIESILYIMNVFQAHNSLDNNWFAKTFRKKINTNPIIRILNKRNI